MTPKQTVDYVRRVSTDYHYQLALEIKRPVYEGRARRSEDLREIAGALYNVSLSGMTTETLLQSISLMQSVLPFMRKEIRM